MQRKLEDDGTKKSVDGFVLGDVYYRVTYPDSALLFPGIESFVYIGKNLSDADVEDTWYFQPSSDYGRKKSALESDASEDLIICATSADIVDIFDLGNLISELQSAEDRRVAAKQARVGNAHADVPTFQGVRCARCAPLAAMERKKNQTSNETLQLRWKEPVPIAMTWFTASIITAIKADSAQDGIPVFEDFYLIEAESRILALELAEKIGRDLEALDDGLTLCGKDAKRIFLGIRKLRSIYNEGPGAIDSLPPSSGTELSHSYYEAKSWTEAEQLASGQRVDIQYVDDAD